MKNKTKNAIKLINRLNFTGKQDFIDEILLILTTNLFVICRHHQFKSEIVKSSRQHKYSIWL